MPRQDLIQVRRGTAAQWTSANPTLDSGEFGFETDTNKLKCGDGSTAWNSLDYISGGSGAGDMLQSVYDPTNVEGDAFYMENMVEGSTNKIFTSTERTKLSGIEDNADVTDATNVASAGATMNTDADVSANVWVIDEDDMASDSATKVPTQQSVKAYVDANLGNYIPLTGTEVGSPVTGDIEFESGVFLRTTDNSFIVLEDVINIQPEGGGGITVSNGKLIIDYPISGGNKGLVGNNYYGANYDDNTYVQKKYVDDNFFYLPTEGTDGQVLTTDGAGTYTWENVNTGLNRELIVVAEGQSNMTADDANITAYDITINNNVLIWDNSGSEWDVLNPTDYSTADNIYFHFARKYQEVNGGVVKIILNANGGTPIEDWIQTGSVDRHQLLIDQLTNAGISKVDVHLWHQGESNASDPAYIFKLRDRIDLLESLPQYDTNEFTFLFGEPMPKAVTDSYDIVRATMVCYENVINKKNVAFVRSTGLNSVSTGAGVDVHFDGEDLYKLGQRYYEVYNNISIGQNIQSSPPHIVSEVDSDDWDLTSNTFIINDSSPATIIIPRSQYNKEYTIIVERSQINLHSYTSSIDGNALPLKLSRGKNIHLKGINDNDTIDYQKIISIQNDKNEYLIATSTATLSNIYNNSIIRVTTNTTVTVPQSLAKNFKCTFDVVSGSLTLVNAAGVNLTNTSSKAALPNQWVYLYRYNEILENYRSKIIPNLEDIPNTTVTDEITTTIVLDNNIVGRLYNYGSPTTSNTINIAASPIVKGYAECFIDTTGDVAFPTVNISGGTTTQISGATFEADTTFKLVTVSYDGTNADYYFVKWE